MLKYLNNLDAEEMIARISFCAFIGFCFFVLVKGIAFPIALHFFNQGIYF